MGYQRACIYRVSSSYCTLFEVYGAANAIHVNAMALKWTFHSEVVSSFGSSYHGGCILGSICRVVDVITCCTATRCEVFPDTRNNMTMETILIN